MANEVYANGMEIACKAAAGKTVAAFPDVCLSPPSPPAGPVPLPYPNTAYASDTTKGSKTVMISGQEVMLKDKSTFSKSTGDEAATKTLGMGVVTHQITGEVSFTSWSMDVKIEGENVVRHLDLTLHNEQCMPANTPTWPYLDANALPKCCEDDAKAIESNCPNSGDMGKTHHDCPPYYASKTKNAGYRDDPCVKAKRCMLVPYNRAKSQGGCCKDEADRAVQTPHHLVPKHHFKSNPKYDENDAPCVCAEGHSNHRGDDSNFPDYAKTHADMHDIQDKFERDAIDAVEKAAAAGRSTSGRTPDQALNYFEAREVGMEAHNQTFGDSCCNEDCLQAQLDAYHNHVGVKETDPVDTMRQGSKGDINDGMVETMAKKVSSKIVQMMKRA
jgi:hypothetical protein